MNDVVETELTSNTDPQSFVNTELETLQKLLILVSEILIEHRNQLKFLYTPVYSRFH